MPAKAASAAKGLRERHGEPAPPAAYVEYPGARPEIELGGDVRLLRRLGRFQRHFGIGEVGAAILEILVEEEPVEVFRQVIVMRDVAARLADRIGARKHSRRQLAGSAENAGAGPSAEVSPDQLHEGVERAALDHQCARHVALAELIFRVERQQVRGPAILHMDRDIELRHVDRHRADTERRLRADRDGKPPDLDHLAEQFTQHRALPRARSAPNNRPCASCGPSDGRTDAPTGLHGWSRRSPAGRLSPRV